MGRFGGTQMRHTQTAPTTEFGGGGGLRCQILTCAQAHNLAGKKNQESHSSPILRYAPITATELASADTTTIMV